MGGDRTRRSGWGVVGVAALWVAFYGSVTLRWPALLDDADSVHAEVAREMLLRHDWVTLYANGIRYLEKAPLLYWGMAGAMRVAQALGWGTGGGVGSADALAVAARVPLALGVLGLALVVEALGRRMFGSGRAGLYAALVLLSSPGMFLFTRILLPDGLVCLWLAVAMYALWRMESPQPGGWPGVATPEGVEGGTRAVEVGDAGFSAPLRSGRNDTSLKGNNLTVWWAGVFGGACALGVLSKGLIGVVFPVGIAGVYLLLTRGWRGAWQRLREMRVWVGVLVFFAVAVPWHVLVARANPAEGRPVGVGFVLHPAGADPTHRDGAAMNGAPGLGGPAGDGRNAGSGVKLPDVGHPAGDGAETSGHWTVGLPSDGNVHGWAWFYFVNEQVLRYLNLRVPRDYDTVPLWLFWGLCVVWMMPWSGFAFKAFTRFVPVRSATWRGELWRGRMDVRMRGWLLLGVWAAFVLLFFVFSTRQEYYVLPMFPAIAVLVGGWLSLDSQVAWQPVTAAAKKERRTNLRITTVWVGVGVVFAAGAGVVLWKGRGVAAGGDLAALLQQNPGDYAMSMGHFLDLNARALGLFRVPLGMAAVSLLGGPAVSLWLRKRGRAHGAVLALAAGAFGFLLTAHVGLQRFAPVLSSAELARAVAPLMRPGADGQEPLVVIHQEYEFGSTLGFYLQRPGYRLVGGRRVAVDPIHILTEPEYRGTVGYGRSSNLWYGSYFGDAPKIWETRESLAREWAGRRRVLLWQDLGGEPSELPELPGPVYVIARSGGKEVVSNRTW